MSPRSRSTIALLALLLAFPFPTPAGAQSKGEGPFADYQIVKLKNGPEVLADLKIALSTAEPETVIQLPAATIEVDEELSLSTDRVVIRGKGRGKTVLDFAKQASGSSGFLITGDHVTLEDFKVVDTPGDGIRAEGTRGITFRRLWVGWSGKPSSQNGAHALAPVLSEDVRVENCKVVGASEAGIYMERSTNIIVRNNKVRKSVAGIAIANSTSADVHHNILKKNTVGAMVSNLPGLDASGSRTRVYQNEIVANNTIHFGNGTMGRVPPGTGVIVLASDEVEIFKNRIRDHKTVAIAVASYNIIDPNFDDEDYDPYAETIHIHDNDYSNNGFSPNDGSDPDDLLGFLVGAVYEGKPPDIFLAVDEDPEKLVEGTLPEALQTCIEEDQKKLSFGQMNLFELLSDPLADPVITRESTRNLGPPHRCAHPPLDKVVLPDPDAFEDLFLSDRVLNIAHRGGRRLWPEHTLLAYQNALDAGTDVLELDVHSTSDDVLVVLHDGTVDRTTNGTGSIHGMTLAELETFDAGHDFSPDGGASYPYRGTGLTVPTVRDVFEAFPDEWFVIEVKQADPSIAEALIALIEASGLEQKVILASFSDEVTAEIRSINPRIKTALSQTEVMEFFVLGIQDEATQAAYEPPGLFHQVPLSFGDLQVITRAYVRRAHRYGMKVQPWTINDPDDMRWLIELGVDGIMTDDPVTLDSVIAEYE